VFRQRRARLLCGGVLLLKRRGRPGAFHLLRAASALRRRALAIAFVSAPPVGVHERYNRRWIREQGAGLKQRDPRYANQWLEEWLDDGLLGGAAWSGFMRLPKFGLYRILRLVSGRSVPTAAG